MKEKPKVSLEGFAPVHRKIIDDLNFLCDGINLDLVLLESIARDTPFFKETSKLKTKDGHSCWVLNFETTLGKIAVLFPMNNDLSIATFATGEFERGPQSMGELYNDIDNVLGAIKEALSKLQ